MMFSSGAGTTPLNVRISSDSDIEEEEKIDTDDTILVIQIFCKD